MKKKVSKYLLEFLVIVMGISISFYVEKRNANMYKQTLKNQSLHRISNNIKVDIADMEYNYTAHTIASDAIAWIVNNNSDLLNQPKDSIGKNISNAILVNTIFVDNQEEYRALQSSGLIELIEIEKVVSALQNKYSAHEFYKQIEKAITDSSRPLEEFLYSNTILVDERTNRLGFQSGRIFTGDKKIPQPIIERLKGKKWLHDFYIDRVKTLMKRDSTLIKLIEDEI